MSPAQEFALAYSQGVTGLSALLNSSDRAEQINQVGQIIASLATMATSPAAALAVANANAMAGIVTAKLKGSASHYFPNNHATSSTH